jgi:hypothetical protein
MTETRHLRTHGQVQALTAYLSKSLPCTVTITGGIKRSERQNRLQHMWNAEIAAQLGDRTPNDVRAWNKLHIGVPILRAGDEDFRARYDAVVRPMDYETKLALMVEPFDFPVSRLMSKAQSMQFLDEVQRHWLSEGLHLTEPL